jgi:CheY-like chemotaxis protein
MSERAPANILCVDDEARVVEGISLHLRKDYKVWTALSGDEGLKKLKEIGEVAVVISDMRMPGMDGATFLKRVMRAYPETTRILLTGEPGRDAAVLAVNEGQIYRFLTKPCAPELLKSAVDSAVIQHRMVIAERLVLRETLIGCIQALVDVLAMTNPVAFGRSRRITRLAMQFAGTLNCVGYWQLEAAAMLSQIGYLSLPVELAEKMYYGETLTPEEKVLAEGIPQVANKLLDHIPRLEPVVQILVALGYSDEQLHKLGEGTIGLGTIILSLALEYDTLLAQGHSNDVAVQTLRGKVARYGETLVEKFAAMVGAASGINETRMMPLRLVRPGMIIQQDLRTQMGTLLVPRGFEVSETFLQRLHNFGSALLEEKIKVLVPAPVAVGDQMIG